MDQPSVPSEVSTSSGQCVVEQWSVPSDSDSEHQPDQDSVCGSQLESSSEHVVEQLSQSVPSGLPGFQ